MRSTSILRQLSGDPAATHLGIKSKLWSRVRDALVVNPESGSGAPLVLEHRNPPPGSRPEKFTVPSSQASDVAFNPYWKRDFRRAYPKTEVVTQSELALLLTSQGGFTSLPNPPIAATDSTTSVTTTSTSTKPTLSSIYLTTTPTASFVPPTPPGFKYKWKVATEVVPSGEDSYFPMYNMSSERIL